MTLLAKPWIWSFGGALLVFLAAIAFTGGYGANGMITAPERPGHGLRFKEDVLKFRI